MEMQFTKLERVVGIFIIGVTLLLMTTLVIIGRGKDWFEKYTPFYTTFNETYNLQENAAVKLFKADIGKVKSITLEKNRVRVKLLILDQYSSRIRQDALAVVESPTLIGSEYISIIPGSQDAPLIETNGEIPSREKRSITDIMSEFEIEKTAKMVVKAIQDITVVTQRLSDAQGPLWTSLDNINKISANIEQITDDLKAGKGPMGMMLKSEDLLQQVVSNVTRLGHILESIQAATDQAPATMELVKENLNTYRDAGASVKARVDQARELLEAIKRSAGDLQVILENVKVGSTQVPRITTTFRDGIQEIRQGMAQIDRVVDSLQKNVLIRSNLPSEPPPENTTTGSRPE
jgi:phospholipid/cholesterol/gamma-HCH transport system substrate-binding protein